MHAARAIEFANSGVDFLLRPIVKGLEYNKLMLAVFETPATLLQQQPFYYDKFVHTPGLKEVPFCRCRLYETPVRKETIILTSVYMWRANRMTYEELICTQYRRRARVGDKRKSDIICVGLAAQANAQLETALCKSIAKACLSELLFYDRFPE